MKEASEIKAEILSLVREYFHVAFDQTLKPGTKSIPPSGKVFDEKELANLVEASLDFWLTEGRFNAEFEKKLAEYFGLNHAVTTNSGSSANLLAFYSLTAAELGEKRIKKGDEIIGTAACFPTTVSPVVQYGCIPVLVDISLPTYNASYKNILKAVTPKTKAIFLAHTLGNPFEVEEVSNYCKQKDIWLIEDCCDALGATYNGKKVGTFGDISTLSFYPAHQITCGEGGALLTNNAGLNKLIRSYRDWGRDCWCAPGKDNTCSRRFEWKLGDLPYGYDHKYIYSHMGFNLKMTDMQASVGLAQLSKIHDFIRLRRENFNKIKEKLSEFSEYLILPEATFGSDPSWFGFLITIKPTTLFDRKDLLSHLENMKIGTRLLFAGNITKQPAFKDVKYRIVGDLSNCDLAMNNSFWIGCYPAINDEAISYMYKSFKSFFGNLEK